MRWWVDRSGQRLEVAVQRLGERFTVSLDGRTHNVELVAAAPGLFALLCEDGRSFTVAGQKLAAGRYRVSLGDRDFEVHLRDPLEREVATTKGVAGGPQEVRAPIPGKVVRVEVSEGEAVAEGQTLLVLEAMKMENQICAERPGTVDAVLVSPGGTVERGQVLIVVR